MGGGSSKNKDTQQHDDEGQEDEDVEREELNNEPRRSVVEKKDGGNDVTTRRDKKTIAPRKQNNFNNDKTAEQQHDTQQQEQRKSNNANHEHEREGPGHHVTDEHDDGQPADHAYHEDNKRDNKKTSKSKVKKEHKEVNNEVSNQQEDERFERQKTWDKKQDEEIVETQQHSNKTTHNNKSKNTKVTHNNEKETQHKEEVQNYNQHTKEETRKDTKTTKDKEKLEKPKQQEEDKNKTTNKAKNKQEQDDIYEHGNYENWLLDDDRYIFYEGSYYYHDDDGQYYVVGPDGKPKRELTEFVRERTQHDLKVPQNKVKDKSPKMNDRSPKVAAADNKVKGKTPRGEYGRIGPAPEKEKEKQQLRNGNTRNNNNNNNNKNDAYNNSYDEAYGEDEETEMHDGAETARYTQKMRDRGKQQQQPQQQQQQRHRMEMREKEEFQSESAADSVDNSGDFDDVRYQKASNRHNDSAWRRYHPDLKVQLARERLREAMTDASADSLRKAVDICRGVGIHDDDPDVRRAEMLINVFEAKRKLSNAKATKDPRAILSEVEEIEDSRYYSYMQTDVWDAHQLIRRLARLEKLRRDILNLDKNTMSELRRYHKPPPVIHKVIQAALLLLGYDEERTGDWRECQKLCNPQGQNGLNRKIMMFDITKLHPEIAARSNQILENYKLSDVQKVSLGASTFYVWAMGAIDERKGLSKSSGNDEGGDSPANASTSDTSSSVEPQPADITRQKELLYGIRPPEPGSQSPTRARRKFIHGGGGTRRSHDASAEQQTNRDDTPAGDMGE